MNNSLRVIFLISVAKHFLGVLLTCVEYIIRAISHTFKIILCSKIRFVQFKFLMS
jgi:hypothetical protein